MEEFILAYQKPDGTWRVVTVQPTREEALSYLEKARRRSNLAIVLCQKTEGGLRILEAYGVHANPEASTVIPVMNRKTKTSQEANTSEADL